MIDIQSSISLAIKLKDAIKNAYIVNHNINPLVNINPIAIWIGIVSLCIQLPINVPMVPPKAPPKIVPAIGTKLPMAAPEAAPVKPALTAYVLVFLNLSKKVLGFKNIRPESEAE